MSGYHGSHQSQYPPYHQHTSHSAANIQPQSMATGGTYENWGPKKSKKNRKSEHTTQRPDYVTDVVGGLSAMEITSPPALPPKQTSSSTTIPSSVGISSAQHVALTSSITTTINAESQYPQSSQHVVSTLSLKCMLS